MYWGDCSKSSGVTLIREQSKHTALFKGMGTQPTVLNKPNISQISQHSGSILTIDCLGCDDCNLGLILRIINN